MQNYDGNSIGYQQCIKCISIAKKCIIQKLKTFIEEIFMWVGAMKDIYSKLIFLAVVGTHTMLMTTKSSRVR
jgi:hypothetical protein